MITGYKDYILLQIQMDFKTELFSRNYINRLQHITGSLPTYPLYFRSPNEAQGQAPFESPKLFFRSLIFSNYFTWQ